MWRLHISKVVLCNPLNTITKPGRKQREKALNIVFFISYLREEEGEHTLTHTHTN